MSVYLSVCLSRTSGLSREQRGLGRLKLAQRYHSVEATHVSHVTLYHIQGQKVKGQGHQAALLSAAVTRKAAAAVSVGTRIRPGKVLLRCVCSAAREALGRPRRRRGARAYCVAMRTTCWYSLQCVRALRLPKTILGVDLTTYVVPPLSSWAWVRQPAGVVVRLSIVLCFITHLLRCFSQ